MKFKLLSFLLLGASLSAQATVIYSNDFQTNTTGFSTSGRTSLPTDGAGFGSAANSLNLGAFGGNSAATLTLSGLTAGVTYSLAFDLFIGASWDGNSTNGAGPDQWKLSVQGGPTLVNTTFINLLSGEAGLNNFTQNYSDTNVNGPGTNAAFTGADIVHSPGASIFDRYAIYYFGHGSGNPLLSFTAAGSTVALDFQGINLQDTSDEFWALDNVTVTASITQTVPEGSEGTALIALAALSACGWAIRRQAPSIA